MATKRPTTASVDTTQQPPTAVALELGKQPPITLIPLPLRRKVDQLITEAKALAVIGSAKALQTADAIASTMKALEVEIETNCKEQLAGIKALIKAADQGVAAVHEALAEARLALAERVVAAKSALGYEETTSCYAQTVDELKILELHKIPFTVKIPVKGGGFEEVQILKTDDAAIKRAWKAGVAVPGTYVGSKTQIGTRST